MISGICSLSGAALREGTIEQQCLQSFSRAALLQVSWTSRAMSSRHSAGNPESSAPNSLVAFKPFERFQAGIAAPLRLARCGAEAADLFGFARVAVRTLHGC